VFMSDNGPQFSSKDMKEFACTYAFDLLTNSPLFPQSNGLAVRTIKTVKLLLKDSADPYMAHLIFRSAPIPWCQFSPAELLMGRKLKTDVPILKSSLTPHWPYTDTLSEKDKEYKKAQKEIDDQRHRTRYQDPLPPDSPVWIRSGNDLPTPGNIVSPAGIPRSYIVETPSKLRRTHYHLTERSPVMTRSRSGVTLRPPDRLRP